MNGGSGRSAFAENRACPCTLRVWATSSSSSACPSPARNTIPRASLFEPPYELSGLGALMGSAIQLDPTTGMAALKLEFSLSKRGSRTSPVGAGNGVADSVNGEPRKMTLRGLLHYLWHEAGMTKWTSAWVGKRRWWNLQWHLLEAAKQMVVKGAPLSDILYIPEQFRSQNKQAIEQRRTEALVHALPPKSGPRPLMVLVGEVKEFASALDRV